MEDKCNEEEVNQEIHQVNAFTEEIIEPELLVNECCMSKNDEPEMHDRPMLACLDEATNSRDSTKYNETNLTSDGTDLSTTTNSDEANPVLADQAEKTSDSNMAKSTPLACSEHHSMLEFAMMNFKQSIEK